MVTFSSQNGLDSCFFVLNLLASEKMIEVLPASANLQAKKIEGFSKFLAKSTLEEKFSNG